MTRWTLLAGLAPFVALGCGPGLAAGGEEGFSDGYEQGEDDTGPEPEPEPEPEPPGDLPKDGDGCQDALDILMIVDNSYSMGSAQRRAAQAIGGLLGPMDAAGVDWRFAVTNTGIYGHPAGTSTQPLANGAFVFTPCVEQLEYFGAGGDDGYIDVTQIACTDLCPYAQGEIARVPSTTHLDASPQIRPWVERIDGVSNVAAGLDPLVVARCVAPQGIDGSGYEQPLEAMALGLGFSEEDGRPEAGFLRPDASLLIVIVTDEADCSTADFSIFSVFSDDTFWAEGASGPSGAICWNAGVTCSGPPWAYDSCAAIDYDAAGNPTAPASAVMHPVSRYVDLLETIEAQKRAIDPGADVALTLIAGIGLDGSYHYADVQDEQRMFDYGVGPGCEVPDPFLPGQIMDATPPVRLRAVAEAISTGTVTSICQANFSSAFANIYEQLFGAC